MTISRCHRGSDESRRLRSSAGGFRSGKRAAAGALSAFSFIEVLAALAVVAILAACILPVAAGVMKGSQLSLAAHTVTDQLALARQRALSRNQSVEVRFYGETPSQTENSPASVTYRALQLFEIRETGEAIPLGKLQHLPESVLIDSSAALSTLLSPSQAKEWTATDPQISLPGLTQAYECKAFRYLPDGSADLVPPTARWFLTLHNTQAGDGLSTPPQNFFCIQIDPHNGNIRTFRP